MLCYATTCHAMPCHVPKTIFLQLRSYKRTLLLSPRKYGGKDQSYSLQASHQLFILFTIVSLFLTARMLHFLLSYITIFMLTACLPSFCSLTAQAFLLPLIPILSNSLMQELTSTLNNSYLSLVNSGTPYLDLY